MRVIPSAVCDTSRWRLARAAWWLSSTCSADSAAAMSSTFEANFGASNRWARSLIFAAPRPVSSAAFCASGSLSVIVARRSACTGVNVPAARASSPPSSSRRVRAVLTSLRALPVPTRVVLARWSAKSRTPGARHEPEASCAASTGGLATAAMRVTSSSARATWVWVAWGHESASRAAVASSRSATAATCAHPCASWAASGSAGKLAASRSVSGTRTPPAPGMPGTPGSVVVGETSTRHLPSHGLIHLYEYDRF